MSEFSEQERNEIDGRLDSFILAHQKLHRSSRADISLHQAVWRHRAVQTALSTCTYTTQKIGALIARKCIDLLHQPQEQEHARWECLAQVRAQLESILAQRSLSASDTLLQNIQSLLSAQSQWQMHEQEWERTNADVTGSHINAARWQFSRRIALLLAQALNEPIVPIEPLNDDRTFFKKLGDGLKRLLKWLKKGDQ